MVAAQGLVDEGKGGVGCVEEERVIVAADKPIEVGEFGWGEAVDVPRGNVPVLP